jgi:hypothetical protein
LAYHLFPVPRPLPFQAQEALAALIAESLPNAHAAGAIAQMKSLLAAIIAEQPLVSA